MPNPTIGFYKFTGVAILAIDAKSFDEIHHVIFTTSSGANLNHSASIYDHGNHGGITYRAG
jgi:hypothetical protein